MLLLKLLTNNKILYEKKFFFRWHVSTTYVGRNSSNWFRPRCRPQDLLRPRRTGWACGKRPRCSPRYPFCLFDVCRGSGGSREKWPENFQKSCLKLQVFFKQILYDNSIWIDWEGHFSILNLFIWSLNNDYDNYPPKTTAFGWK